ncbi:MAG: transcription-repair coupling factor [Acidobacteria bacterium]|nr:transcription-repair coupling factor [Acidobacteriota bacterium]
MTHPAIRDLLEGLGRNAAFQVVVRRFYREEARHLSLSGLTTTAKALYLVLLAQSVERPLLVVVDGNQQAETLSELVSAFYDLLTPPRESASPQLLPALDVLPHQHLSPHTDITEQRAIALWRLATRNVPVTVTPIASALLRTGNRDFYRQLALHLRVSEELPLDDFLAHLESIGYQKRDPVELVGEFSVRGGIVDVFPAEAPQPVRIEFFGDLVESMRRFDVETQRSVMEIKDAPILPLLEYPRTRPLLAELAAHVEPQRGVVPGEEFPGWEFYVPLLRPRTATLLDLAKDAVVVWDEPEQIAGAAERFWTRLEEARAHPVEPGQNFLRPEELRQAAAMRMQLSLRELEIAATDAQPLHIPTRPSISFHGNMQIAVAETRNIVERGGRVLYFAASPGELERLADILQEYRVPYQLGVESTESLPGYLAERAYMAGTFVGTFLVKGLVRRGAAFLSGQVTFIGFEDLFGTSELVGQPSKSRSALAAFAADIADLMPGDYVVHAQHGVGRFLGLRTIAHGEQSGEFMLLEYASEAKLYVPLTRLDLVQKYRGAGEAAPPLDRLGGTTWNKTKSRVKARMRDMAEELLKLYAERKLAEGFAFSSDSNWQREFEDAFEYAETRDQLTAIRDIKRDMEHANPMDRLLCGDVGFGKTEVAMRAAFKALGDGKQVAVLAPTTVLTLQHHETFKRRFAAFPVRVEMLSRFRSPSDIRQTLEDMAAGKVDIVIGTHRLLSKDVVFHDLGLLVVDEEQRFGVRHKERLKELKKNVDVLTMSATPIPRTLHMSLLGIRDMSVIETPPKDRLAIHTVVAHFDPDLVRTAIEQELNRGGQVYYIHNRVDTIFARAALIRELLPGARISVGHGQMGEAELERVLLGFMRHEHDVFVCTTIAENGLDIPLANTMIVEHAERYGLSELYQLRGRVGRSNRRAYAYLLVPADTELSDVARKRLAALKEFSDLGAGFKIAALDLELRGAGNLLGGEQHGHIAAVGFDTYLKLLEETVLELKGEEVPLEIHSSLNLGLDIRIPLDYIAGEHQRLRIYKRIGDATDSEAAARIREELEDRYGPPPEAVLNLLRFSVLKSTAQRVGVEAIDRRGGMLNLKFHPQSKVAPARLLEIVQSTPGAQFTPAGVLRLPLAGLDTPSRLLAYLTDLLAAPVTVRA